MPVVPLVKMINAPSESATEGVAKIAAFPGDDEIVAPEAKARHAAEKAEAKARHAAEKAEAKRAAAANKKK